MPNEVLPYYEALLFLKHWSTVLLIIQTAILIVFCFLTCQQNNDMRSRSRTFFIFTLVFSALSVLVGLNVIGTMPWSVQALPLLVTKYHDIYQFPNYVGIPIWLIAFGQHFFAVLAVACLLVYAISQKASPFDGDDIEHRNSSRH